MDISTLLSGAGQVSTGVREREEELRRAQLQQLAVEDANRRAKTERSITGLAVPVEPGSFGDTRADQGVGARPPKPVASAPAAPATAGVGVQVRKPTTQPVPLNTTAVREAVKDPRQLTQEQFRQLSPRAQQELYDAHIKKVQRENALNRGPRDEFGVQIPTGLPSQYVPKSLEDFITELPTQSGPRGRGGTRKKAGVAMPGSDAPVQTAGARDASQYDKPTQYDSLIQQAAEQYGLDPVVFKRLLGTESSFDPNAVSPRGAKFGLGIGQIASSWGLSDAERLDPNTAIPMAAQIFAQYLAAAGGDYTEAMMKYKGASSEKGRASMAPIIAGIVGGGADGAVATLAANDGPALQQAIAAGGQRPAAGQRLPAQAPAYDPEYTQPQRQPRAPGQQSYQADPEAINGEIRNAMIQREELVKMAMLYQQGGMGAEYGALRQQIIALDQQMGGLVGIQAVQNLEAPGGAAELSKMLTYFRGRQIDLKPYTDGSYDITIDGELTHENVSGDQIKQDAMSLFDPSFREKVASRSEATHKSNLELQRKITELQITGFNQLNLATLNGNVQIAVEQLKQRGKGRFDIKPLGDGSIAITPLDGSNNGVPFVWSPEGRTVTIDDQEYTVNSAQPIAGLR